MAPEDKSKTSEPPRQGPGTPEKGQASAPDTDPAKKQLESDGNPYILIRLPSKSIMEKDQNPEKNATVDTNIIPEMFSSTIIRLAISIQNPPPAQPPPPPRAPGK